MTETIIKRYYPESSVLKNLIKYFWVLESGGPIEFNHKILPVSNIDIIFNLLSPMQFEKEGVLHETPGNVFFSGLSGGHIILKQKGVVLTIGVSFFPAGFYPFFGIPVSEFKNDTIGLETLLTTVAVDLEERLRSAETAEEKVVLIERFFLDHLDVSNLPSTDIFQILNKFFYSSMEISEFCKNFEVHPRKLERIFNKYIGASPKLFSRLNRFQLILNRLIANPPESLTTLAHEIEFSDQSHFINDFKSFAGTPPLQFLKEKKSFRQIMNQSS